MNNLGFDFAPDVRPLAARMRPLSLEQYVGQQHIIGPSTPLYKALQNRQCHSLVLWGPPGIGKTSLAEIIASTIDAEFSKLSAVTAGVKEIRDAVVNAKHTLSQRGARTLLFVDEVHRFNKSQQDALLPHIEDGTFIFIGATTENPSFALNNAILSRARVYTLKALTNADLMQVVKRAIAQDSVLKQLDVEFASGVVETLCDCAQGDARLLLNLLEQCIDVSERADNRCLITSESIVQIVGQHSAKYDKSGELFYDLISAFHKSVRGSAPDAALYWYAKILAGGGDPLYVARRLLAIATEDIGNADPRAMQVALNAWDIFQRVGPAEGERAIAQATLYLACAPKSNAVYMAFNQAKQDALTDRNVEVPLHLRNAPTNLMKDLGYGDEYRYAHNEPGAYAAGENFFPESLKDRHYYHPTDRGLEKQLSEKLVYLRHLDEQSLLKRYK